MECRSRIGDSGLFGMFEGPRPQILQRSVPNIVAGMCRPDPTPTATVPESLSPVAGHDIGGGRGGVDQSSEAWGGM